jgi:hypothetical protein
MEGDTMWSNKLDEIKDRVSGKSVGIYDGVCQKHDRDWLITQAEKLDKITNTWIGIEENGTPEDASNFYTTVQDILSEPGYRPTD